jgi:hypothetical protein
VQSLSSKGAVLYVNRFLRACGFRGLIVELWVTVGIPLGGICIGAVIEWVLFRGPLGRLRADLAVSDKTLRSRAIELTDAHRAADNWRSRRLERTRFETEASRVAGLVSELQNVRARVESLAGEKSGLQIEAERVPNLENRVEALAEQIIDPAATKAQLRRRTRRQTGDRGLDGAAWFPPHNDNQQVVESKRR